MAQPIFYTRIRPNTLVSGGSRYLKQNVIYYGETKFMTFDTYLRQPYVAKGDEKVMVITKGVEYRPDLVSYDFYGFPDNWWRILEANGMYDVFDFKSGKTILLPNQVI